MRIYGARPRPRALVLSYVLRAEPELDGIFPTVEVVNDLATVRQSEFDVLVTRSSAERAAPHLFVLALGATELGRTGMQVDTYPYVNSRVGFFAGSLARELTVPDGLPQQIRRAVFDDLLPKALAGPPPHQVLAIGTHRAGQLQPVRSLQVFLQTSAGEPLAGSFVRPGFASEIWALPSYADVARWARVAIDEWRPRAPERFPRAWHVESRWLTAEEEDIAAARSALVAQREAAIHDFDARELQLEADARAASERAAGGERRLLTAQGDELVGAVTAALEELGLRVQNMDAVFPETNRREDLRLTAPEDPAWEAIVEVRGYGGGAQLSDLLRLNRFAQRYREERKRDPSACWYVCNQFIGGHPEERPPMLVSNPEETRTFRESYPLALIDTRELFLIQKQLRRAHKVPEQVRAELLRLNDRLVA